MCLAAPSTPAVVQQSTPLPPPPPNQTPKAPDLDPQSRNQRENASTQRRGTSIFRNDLTIPVGGGSTGSGVNIPK